MLIKLQHSIVGLPDRALLKPGGKTILVEFKRPGEPLKRIQRYWLERLAWMGFRAYRIDSLAEFKKLLTW